MKNRQSLFILSSSQKSKSCDGTVNLEKLARKYYKASEILRIDSQTTSDPQHPAFGISGEHLSSLIKAGSYQVIIASPTISTGISIDGVDRCFDAVFSFQAGNLTPNSVRQQLVRLRDFQAERHLWCPKTGKCFIGSKSSNPIELLTDQKGEAKLSLELLSYREAEQLIDSNICPLTKYWARVGASTNSDNYHYREILISDLEEDGWNVIVEQADNCSEASKAAWIERQEIKSDSIKEENDLIVSAKDITELEAEKIKRARSRSSSQELQLKKHEIKQKYSVEEVTSQLIEADAEKFYPALRLRFWLTDGRKYLKSNNLTRIKKQWKRGGGSLFIPDFNNSCDVTKVNLLEILNPILEQLDRPGTEWSNKSPLLIELKEFVLKDLTRFNQILNCGISVTDSPITIAQKIKKLVGQKLPYLRNERDGKKRLRIYGAAVSRFSELQHLEEDILNSWLKIYQAQYSDSNLTAISAPPRRGAIEDKEFLDCGAA